MITRRGPLDILILAWTLRLSRSTESTNLHEIEQTVGGRDPVQTHYSHLDDFARIGKRVLLVCQVIYGIARQIG